MFTDSSAHRFFLLLYRRPLRFHRNTLDLKLDTFRANQKLLTRAEKKLTPERTVDDNNNSAKPNWLQAMKTYCIIEALSKYDIAFSQN